MGSDVEVEEGVVAGRTQKGRERFVHGRRQIRGDGKEDWFKRIEDEGLELIHCDGFALAR